MTCQQKCGGLGTCGQAPYLANCSHSIGGGTTEVNPDVCVNRVPNGTTYPGSETSDCVGTATSVCSCYTRTAIDCGSPVTCTSDCKCPGATITPTVTLTPTVTPTVTLMPTVTPTVTTTPGSYVLKFNMTFMGIGPAPCVIWQLMYHCL